MRDNKRRILVFSIILSFSLAFYAVNTAYSQWGDYFSSYVPTYYLSWLYDTSGIMTSAYGQTSPYITTSDTAQTRNRTMNDYNMFYTQSGIFEPQSIHYSGMVYSFNSLVDGFQDGSLFLRNDTLFRDGIFNHISGNYQSMANPMPLFNQSYAYTPGMSSNQSPRLSIQKCLQDRPDLDTTQCVMFHRDPSLLSAMPSTDYLSLYFLCFEDL